MGAKGRARPAPRIRTERAYGPRGTAGGKRYLVDRLWPRGISKDDLGVDGWLRDVAPSDALRTWYAHDPQRWPEFEARYARELDAAPESWRELADAAAAQPITLVFAARDEDRNNAVALARYLERRLGGRLAGPPKTKPEP